MRFFPLPSYRDKNKNLLEERYKNFTVEAFIQDAFFYEWVTAPTAHHDAFWQKWMHLHPEKKATVEKARQVIKQLISEEGTQVTDFMEQDWQQIRAATDPAKPVISHNRNIQQSAARRGIAQRGVAQRYAVAACFLLLLGFGLYLWWQQNTWHTITTAYGEQQTILLPDGSEVILNGNSQLRYATDWKHTADKREVWLDGEAFFQVTKFKTSGAAVKFTVHTSRMQVEVLGTAFNVRSRKQQTQVVLTEGSVLVHNAAADSLLLQPGEMVELNEQQHRLTKKAVNDKMYTSWKEQKLTFDNEKIEHIFSQIQNTYGWEIETTDTAWLQQRYTGSVPEDQVELLFDKLAVLYDMNMKRQNKKVWFDKK